MLLDLFLVEAGIVDEFDTMKVGRALSLVLCPLPGGSAAAAGIARPPRLP
jgi:hypothetical protein